MHGLTPEVADRVIRHFTAPDAVTKTPKRKSRQF
jgi:hypothetical protein